MFSTILLVVAVLMLSAASGEAECDYEPFSLALTDVQVLPDVKSSFMRGIPAKIGSAEQEILLLPWPELNNTYIYDNQAFCDKTIIWSDTICEVRRGNLFKPSASDSYTKAKDVPDAGGAREEAALEGSEKGIGKLMDTSLGAADILSLNDSIELEDFPLASPRLRWDHGYTFLHSLGMGRNSTCLNALKDAGKISARVWSIFWGRMWTDDPLDGSVVIGGYDSAKVIGDNYTEALDFTDADGSGCWTGMKIIVRDIKLNDRDGSDRSIFPSNTALPFCIVPQRQLLMEAPGSLLDRFEQATGANHTGDSYGLHWSAQLFDEDEAYDGDMTFFLDSGLEIRVPNDQFMTPFVDIDRSGKQVEDRSKREFLMNPVGDQPATLGRYFLTAAYLMVNHDSNSFTLWQANPTSSEELVPVYDEEAADRCRGDVPGLVQPSASTTPTSTPEEQASDDDDGLGSEEDDGGVSSEVIGGAVGGGLGALVIAAAVAFLHIRKRRMKEAAQARAASRVVPRAQPWYEGKNKSMGYYTTGRWGAQEVAGSEPVQPQEVNGSEGPRYYELDAGPYYNRR